jgi:hypothetical protein
MNQLLNHYRTIWNHRLLQGEGISEEILKDAIERDLMDENTHPRVRKTIYEKYYLSTKRIVESTIPPSAKCELLALHIEILNSVIEGK